MRLKDTGLTAAELKAQVKKYMIETYERMDFVADYAEGIYMYDENDEPYLDFYAGIAVNCLGNCNPKVVKAVQDQRHASRALLNFNGAVRALAGNGVGPALRDHEHRAVDLIARRAVLRGDAAVGERQHGRALDVCLRRLLRAAGGKRQRQRRRAEKRQ